jgi:hypothetical protein
MNNLAAFVDAYPLLVAFAWRGGHVAAWLALAGLVAVASFAVVRLLNWAFRRLRAAAPAGTSA